jgi:hypothetical protein
VKQIFEKTDPELAKNPLIFPSPEFTKTCSPTPPLEGEEEQNVIKAFNAVLNG